MLGNAAEAEDILQDAPLSGALRPNPCSARRWRIHPHPTERRNRIVGGPFSAAEELARVLRSVRPMKNQAPRGTDQPPLQRDPDEWKTGDEPMTDAQRSYLETLCRETGEEFDDSLSKADASKRIDELRERSPRLTQE
jgi:hypothetical protein